MCSGHITIFIKMLTLKLQVVNLNMYPSAICSGSTVVLYICIYVGTVNSYDASASLTAGWLHFVAFDSMLIF